MKKVSFGKGKLEFVFESKDEIKKILQGKKIKVPLDKELGEFAVFGLNDSRDNIYGGFDVDAFPEDKILYLNFNPDCLGGFLERDLEEKTHCLVFDRSNIFEDMNTSISVYAPGCYDNKDYLSQ